MRNLLFIVLLAIAGLISGCSKEDDSSSSTSSSGTVKYEVSCTPSGFDITYKNSSGNTEQKDISSGSWSTSFTGDSEDFVYISAQADNENATITAKIYYKGNVIEQATSSGDYVIATASGSLP